jgi:hypothetical protein
MSVLEEVTPSMIYVIRVFNGNGTVTLSLVTAQSFQQVKRQASRKANGKRYKVFMIGGKANATR